MQGWNPYCGAAPSPSEIWARWNLDPPLVAALCLAGWLIWARASHRPRAFLGLAVLWLIFVSPLCALSSALFSARTVHHVLLLTLAAPLLAASLPRVPGGLGAPLAAQALVLWVWHAPAAYGWALGSDAGYWAMQVTLLGTSLWFWRALGSASWLSAAAVLLGAMVAMGLLGAVLTFSQRPFYEPHLASTWAWGLTPLEDQQAAGLIMWVPAAAIYLLAALMAFGRGLSTRAREQAA